MNWLQSVKHNYSVTVFEKRAKKVSFPHAFVDFDKAKTIAFIVNISQFNPEDLVSFTKYISKLETVGKSVVVIELNFERKSLPMFKASTRSIFINPEGINWLKFPAVERLREINRLKCDLLVNLDTSEQMTSHFICGLSNAKTRVGLAQDGYEAFYELLLQLPNTTKITKLLETFEMFTKMLEK
ncbi:MAG TPA: hypothetical protein ENJ82_15890 [Bacteroidetes bacterium]|nr:hypothetical protein [Bacteroidota bacterium]